MVFSLVNIVFDLLLLRLERQISFTMLKINSPKGNVPLYILSNPKLNCETGSQVVMTGNVVLAVHGITTLYSIILKIYQGLFSRFFFVFCFEYWISVKIITMGVEVYSYVLC